ncbi:MAG: hypothetical protein IPG50_37075 [Myxococcales bacterium]|nr:hypothetical protein [Myxococcales bacterium]
MRRFPPKRAGATVGRALPPLAFLAAAAAPLLGACLWVYDPGSLVGVADAAAPRDAEAGPSTFCYLERPTPDFCDDFEGQGNETPDGGAPALPRWNGGGLANKLVDSPENRIAVLVDEVGRSRALAVDVVANDENASLAFVSHEVKPPDERVPRGAKLKARFRVKDVRYADVDAAAADKYLYALGFGDAQQSEGVALMINEELPKLRVTLQQRLVTTSKGRIELVRLQDTDRAGLASDLQPIELIVAPTSVLTALGETCALVDFDDKPVDPAALAQPRDALRLFVRFPGLVRCVALQNEFALGAWLKRVQVVVGAAVGGPGSAAARFDDVAVTLLY